MEDLNARELFRVAPSAYVEERTRLAKAARARGERPVATALAALKRPTLAMWAVIAAADDEASVRTLYEVTGELATAQGGGDRAATVDATTRRKAAVEAVVAAAVAALAAWEPAAEARRPEIRTMIDHLSRQPDLADSWIDATLRELPESDMFGFGAFITSTERDAPSPAPSERRTVTSKPPRRLRSVPDLPPDDVDAAPEVVADVGRDQAALRVAIREADRAFAASAKALHAAQRKVDVAAEKARAAADALSAAELARDEAERHHAECAMRVVELDDRLLR